MKIKNLNFDLLVTQLAEINEVFSKQVQQQVNVAFTLRNWLCGFCIVHYEQQGADTAEYGAYVIQGLADELKISGIKGMSVTNLKLFRQFYLIYPQIGQTLSDQLNNAPATMHLIRQTLSDQFLADAAVAEKNGVAVNVLLNRLSFSHFVELFKAEDTIKRSFYETETIKNNWGVRELQRAMNSMLFERTGLSTDKYAVLHQHEKENKLNPEDVFRNPYVLEFLGLEEKPVYSETDLEQAIINHLQHFLMEMGRGFCFEARQKRITFDNTHYRIDLVFYHRILKTHILIDLKLGAFSHADSGQMNVYLNYYKEHEMTEGDNPPIGIILCANKNDSLVKYATAGLSQQIFVSKYLINLPSEAALKEIIEEEQRKIGRL